MRSVNRLTVLGNVGSVRTFGKVVKLSIATNRVWFDNAGTKHERTDWVPVTILDEGHAEWVASNVGKGDTVYVEARVAQTSYGEGDDRKFSVDVIATLFNKLSSAE